MKNMYFKYGKKEIDYLKSKDKLLAQVIDKIGKINRLTDGDLFSSVINSIVGQQISGKAQQTIMKRITDFYGTIAADKIVATELSVLQSFGLSRRKAEYIKDFASKIIDGSFDVEAIKKMSDEDAIKTLSALKGVGTWTAEMILLFCLQRSNVFSFGDFGILRGLRMVYHHRKIDKKLFEKYRKRFSPYGSVASFYLWEVAGGAIPELKDYAMIKKK